MIDYPEEILTLTELTAHASAILERIYTTGRPAVVMQAGNAVAVIVEAGQYRQVRGELALFRAILAGEQDVRAGQIVSHDDVEVRLNALLVD